MDFWERMILFALIALVLALIYWLLRFCIRVCIRVGAKRAVRDVVGGFRQEVAENKGDHVLDDEKTLKDALKDHSGWYVQDSDSVQFEIMDIGRMLGRIGFSTGENWARERLQPGDGEADVRMKREDLKRIAWLADTGYWLHVDPRYAGVRTGQSFSKDEAELTTRLLDDFERKIVADLFFTNEMPEEQEEQFTQHENRMKSIIWFYS